MLKILALFSTFAPFALLALTSCMTPEPVEEIPIDKKVTVEMAFITESEQGLKSEVSSEDLYGISIYCLLTDKLGSSWARYAYGLFNTPNIPAVEMTQNQHYKIEFTVVKDGAKRIGMDSKSRYRDPFISFSAPTAVTNSFVMSPTEGFSSLFDGLAAVADGTFVGYKRYNRPQIDRYCGLVPDFVPDGSTLNLFAKHTVFGIRPAAVGLTDGKLEIVFDGSAPIVVNSGDDSAPEYIISLAGDKADAYSVIEDEYSESVRVEVKWLRGDGSELTLTPAAGEFITVKRRQSYPFVVKISGSSSNSNIEFEDSALQPADSIIISAHP